MYAITDQQLTQNDINELGHRVACCAVGEEIDAIDVIERRFYHAHQLAFVWRLQTTEQRRRNRASFTPHIG